MRLFIGLWPDDAAVRELSAWAHDAQALCGGRIMQPHDMHLTLAFLGQTDARQTQALVDAVTDWPVSVRPFRLERFGVFERARVVWAGPADNDPLTWLHALYDTLWDRLVTMGHERPDTVFRPHVSLLRRARSCDVSALHRDAVVVYPQRCVLVASRPGETGSHYQMLAQLPVKDSDTPHDSS